jgi:hypothetical protein
VYEVNKQGQNINVSSPVHPFWVMLMKAADGSKVGTVG